MKKSKNGQLGFSKKIVQEPYFLIPEIYSLLLRARKRKIKILFIGGLAVRFYLKKTERITKDIDIAVATKHLDRFRELLETQSYQVGNFDPWFRAVKGQKGRKIIIDFTGENVVELNNFNSLKIDFNLTVLKRVHLNGNFFYIPLPQLEDLILMKLLSWREKDISDVLCILAEKFNEIDFVKYHDKIQLQDLERAVFQGYTALQDFLQSDMGIEF